MKDFFLIGILPIILISAIFISIAYKPIKKSNEVNLAQIETEKTYLRAYDSLASDNIIEVAEKGMRFEIIGSTTGNWIKVILSDTKNVYIAKSTISIHTEIKLDSQIRLYNEYPKVIMYWAVGLLILSTIWLWLWYSKPLPKPKINEVYFAKQVETSVETGINFSKDKINIHDKEVTIKSRRKYGFFGTRN